MGVVGLASPFHGSSGSEQHGVSQQLEVLLDRLVRWGLAHDSMEVPAGLGWYWPALHLGLIPVGQG